MVKATEVKANKTLPLPVASAKAPKEQAPKTPKALAVAPAMKLSIPIDSSAATVDKLIVSIKGRGAKLDIDLHSAACASLNHVKLHNDPTLLNRLINALPKSARRNSVIVWALKFGNVALNDDKTTKEMRPLVYAKDITPDIEAAIVMPFWDLKNVKEGGSDWLYMDYIGNVMKKLALVSADLKNPDHKKAKAAYDALTAVNEAMAASSSGFASTLSKVEDALH